MKGVISQEALTEIDASYKQRFGSRKRIRHSELSSDSTSTRADSQVKAIESGDSADSELECKAAQNASTV